MKEKDKKFKIEGVLERAHLEHTQIDEINKSKIRVWNQFTSSLNNENKKMEIKNSKKTKPNRLLLGTLSFATLVAIVGVSTYVLVSHKNQNTEVAFQIPTPQEVTKIAQSNFQTLTNNQDYKAITALASESDKAKDDPTQLDGIKTKYKSLIDAVTSGQTFYRKDIISFNSNYKFDLVSQEGFSVNNFYGLIDKTKPVEMEIWQGTDFIKTVITQNGKLLNFSMTDNTSNTIYAGGKYSIQSTYPSEVFYPSLEDSNNINDEIRLFQDLANGGLTNGTYSLGTVNNIDGRSVYQIISNNPASGTEGNNMKYIYYIDAKTNRLYKFEEQAPNGDIARSYTNSDAKNYSYGDGEKFNNNNEVNNIPVHKQIVTASEEIIPKNDVSRIDAMWGVYKINNAYINFRDFEDYSGETDTWLSNDDRNPNFDPTYAGSVNKTVNLYTYDVNIDNNNDVYQVNVSENDPTDIDLKDPTLVKKEVDVNMDGKTIKGTYYFTSSKDSNNTVSDDYRLIFQRGDGMWFDIREFEQGNDTFIKLDGSTPINFTHLAQSELAKEDKAYFDFSSAPGLK